MEYPNLAISRYCATVALSMALVKLRNISTIDMLEKLVRQLRWLLCADKHRVFEPGAFGQKKQRLEQELLSLVQQPS